MSVNLLNKEFSKHLFETDWNTCLTGTTRITNESKKVVLDCANTELHKRDI